MDINEAIKSQVDIVITEAQKMRDYLTSDKQLMGQAFNVLSLVRSLQDMVLDRDEGKLTW